MSQPALDRPGVVALVGKRVAAGVAQHVRMGLELQAGTIRGALDHASEACRGERRAALAQEDEGGSRLSRWSRRSARSSSPWGRVRARGAIPDPADVEHGADVKSGPTSATLRFAPCRRGAYVIVGFGAGDRAMLIVLSYATMALLGGLGLLAACEYIEK
jgi:hypothetical protein